MKHLLYLLLFALFIPAKLSAQTTLFAQLNGSPTINTTGWVLNGVAAAGDTPYDGFFNTDNDEMILTQNQIDVYGHCFYGVPINIGTCNKWRVEFDYVMFGGGGADGIAFSFLDQIPQGYVGGGGLGIPGTANGLKICIDPYFNCQGNKPEIQIYNGVGYNECALGIIKLSNTGTTLNFLRNNAYKTVKIEYDNGEVKVSVNNALYLTGNVGPIFMTGYMGFSASTGGVDDRHAIKNVKIFADYVTSNAGADRAICSGESTTLGVATDATKTYNWIPATGLNQANISNPTLTLSNTTSAPVIHEYIVQTGLTNGSSCLSNDTVRITVNPGPTATRTISMCNGATYTINGQNLTAEGAHSVFIANPSGCDSTVTVNISFLPTAMSTTNASICQGASYLFNGTNYSVAGTYDISIPTTNPNASCDSIARLIVAYTTPITSTFNQAVCQGGSVAFGGVNYTTAGSYQHVFTTSGGCDSTVTMVLTINPPLTGIENLQICTNGSVNYHGQTYSAAGTFPVTLQNTASCDSIVALTITTVQAFHTNIASAICSGDSVQLGTHYYKTAGTHDETFISLNGCDSIVHLTLTINPLPLEPDVTTNNPLICFGDEFVASVVDPQSYHAINWTGTGNFTSNSPTISFVTNASNVAPYYVSVSDINDCKSALVTVLIQLNGSDLSNIEFPNVITPNGDQINDILDLNTIFNTCAEFDLIILNRWGDIVFKQQQGDAQFEGKDMNGNKLTPGVYFYKINYEGNAKNGNITLLY